MKKEKKDKGDLDLKEKTTRGKDAEDWRIRKRSEEREG